ncbi:MAG: hypothetical protein WCJ70_00385 [bacterium]
MFSLKKKYTTIDKKDIQKELGSVTKSITQQQILRKEDPKASMNIYKLRYQKALLLTRSNQK